MCAVVIVISGVCNSMRLLYLLVLAICKWPKIQLPIQTSSVVNQTLFKAWRRRRKIVGGVRSDATFKQGGGKRKFPSFTVHRECPFVFLE
jgi:hypothetical protein